MKNSKFFRTRIAPAIPGLAYMSDVDAFRAICQFCHGFCDLATTSAALIEVGGGMSDLDADWWRFERNEGGVWCGGMAQMCAKVLNASGRVDKSWSLGECIALNADGPFDPSWYSDPAVLFFSHASTLASIGGVLYQYDAYFNGEYVDAFGEILPYVSVLRAIKSRKPPAWRQHFREKSIHAESLKNFEEWNDRIVSPPEYRVKSPSNSSGHGLGRGIVTLNTFRMNYYQRDLVDRALIGLGYPADPESELWHYMRIHPVALVNSNYADLDNRNERLLDEIKAIVK